MIGIVIVTVSALIFSLVLVFVGGKKITTTTSSDDIAAHLPGLNCGGCGFAGCKGMAEAILEDSENYKKCRILRKEKLEEFEKYLKEKGLIK